MNVLWELWASIPYLFGGIVIVSFVSYVVLMIIFGFVYVPIQFLKSYFDSSLFKENEDIE